MKLPTAIKSLALATALTSWVYSSHAVVSINETPPFLNGSVTPNIVMTLDDSGSMTRAYVPDGVGALDAARFTSATYNAMYYNPKVLYAAPTRTDGVTYSTTFTQAWVNGFDTGRGSVDLSASGYRPISECAPGDSYSDCSKLTNRGGSTTSSVTTTYTYTNCRVIFNDRSSRDRIDVDYCTFNGSTVDGEDMPDSGNEAPHNSDNSTLTVSNAGGYNGNYSVRDSDADDGYLDIELTRNDYFNSDQTRTGVTLSWSRTATQTVSSAAYYHLYYTDTRSPSRPNNCNDTVGDDDCYVPVAVGSADDISLEFMGGTITADAKRLNFANWYSFYRTRALATMTAATNAVTSLGSNQVRLGWQTLNRSSCTSFGTTCTGYDGTNRENRIRPLDATKTGGTISHRTDFYEWIRYFVVSGATPLRGAMERAGQYYTTSGRDSPYAENPYVTQGSELACRRNFHVMMTDGLWNSNGNTDYGGNVDSTGKTLPDGTVYSPRYPYRNPSTNPPSGQSYSNSLADIAFKYWSTDLRTNLDNKLLSFIPDDTGNAETQFWNPKNNPATWQHMVNFTISFGLSNAMTDPAWGGSTYAGQDYTRLTTGAKTWPGVLEDAAGSATPDIHVYDLWHAAINSRGQFFSADDPIGLRNAFNSVFSNILRNNFSASSLAADSTRLDNGAIIYQARFNPEDWRGQLLAYPVTSEGRVQTSLPHWDAAQKLPAHGQRNITTWTGSAGTNFNACTNLSATQQAALNRNSANVVDNRCADRLAWLRGDTSKEERFNGGIFRNRKVTALGDITNSNPLYVAAEDYGYSNATFTGASSYASFMTTKQSRRPMIYVGANDGMLHGFRADTGDTVQSGRELLAHIPQASFSKLNRLSEPGYAHTYFVDGSSSVGDAYLGTQWKTVLLGSMGIGGRSVFALDVTQPDTYGPTNVMWEFSDAQDADLGLTVSQPQVARLASGQWVAIFGNGYNSGGDRAYLFVVDLQTGTLLRKIAAGTATSNGLSSVTLFDGNGDRITDAVYAGDLQGNLWKFDLSGATAASWGVGNGGQALFTARNAANEVQPITSKVTVTVPSPQPNGGAMILFGTGQYLSTSDINNRKVQSFYAVWDNNTPTTVTRSQLRQQTILAEVTSGGASWRRTSSNALDWNTHRGWYLDLVAPGSLVNGEAEGERVVSTALVRYDRVIFVTATPSTDPCGSGGTSWLMQLSYTSGADMGEALYDVNGDGTIDGNDMLGGQSHASGIKISQGIAKDPLFQENPSENKCFVQESLSSGGLASFLTKCGPPPTPGAASGTIRRIFWQQIQ